MRLRIPVKQIEWALDDNRYTPHLPEQGHLNYQSNETKYIELIPYGCTELRLTVFPDAGAQPLPEPAEPNYTRPNDAPNCVQVVEGHYCAYFEEPRFCWDEPIYCKVRKAGDQTIDMQSNKDGDECTMVGTTANGRKIWRWTGPAVTEAAPAEIIFTNHDLLTCVMPFVNGGYYKYDQMVYNASLTTGIRGINSVDDCHHDSRCYNLHGQQVDKSYKGLIIYKGGKYSNK